MIHLYCGDGKGKTTAAMGLALRSAGRGRRVVIAQFLKGADTGERIPLAAVPGVTLLPVPDQVKFSFALSPEERKGEVARYQAMLEDIHRLCRGTDPGLLVLDEICAGISTGLVPLEPVLALLDGLDWEVVLTGRDPAPALVERADYITEMTKLRHPFDRGIPAREGIER